jgi:nitrogen-specific signal transduction histidine kinase
VKAFPREKSVIIAVSDTGTGILDDAEDKIFKPLCMIKSKGEGFGLPVVKNLWSVRVKHRF